jgi:hypothetical protein
MIYAFRTFGRQATVFWYCYSGIGIFMASFFFDDVVGALFDHSFTTVGIGEYGVLDW